jgi:hypothetical protein
MIYCNHEQNSTVFNDKRQNAIVFNFELHNFNTIQVRTVSFNFGNDQNEIETKHENTI